MKVLGLFSGIGGFELGLQRAGFEIAAMCEIDPFCRAVLHKHWPGVPVAADVTKMRFYEGIADVITGGFPCQDVSCAGKRAGLSGEHSGLYRELVRALRLVRPRHAIVENVAALLGDGMGTVLGDMAESGFDLEWDCVPACTIGAPHERDRVYIVAHSNGIDGWTGTGNTKDWQETGDDFSAGTPADAAYSDNERCGEARELRFQSHQMSAGGTPAHEWRAAGAPSNTASIGRRQGRTRRPPDSFARVRERARWNAADPYGSRLSFRNSVGRDAREKLTTVERSGREDERQSLWPDEPALSGVDDGVPDWVDRTKATGNAVLPQIPELIGRAIKETLSTNGAVK